MKIQCDVCEKQEAAVFCAADEAALCEGCDHRVHHANKLANRHLRFSLLHPSLKEAPLCDICQERRAFLFCRGDRAILCRECDISIHAANEHTQKHSRFLLTGVKLSPSSTAYPTSPSSSSGYRSAYLDAEITSSEPSSSITEAIAVSNKNQPSIPNSTPSLSPNCHQMGDSSVSATSDMQELFTEMPPRGWHFDEFLDYSSTASHSSCKTFDHSKSIFNQQDESTAASFPFEDMKIWAHQGPVLSSTDFPIFLPTVP
ncbi:hypothetical protein Ancab_027381 [Ancistrocladus abbreviatus]